MTLMTDKSPGLLLLLVLMLALVLQLRVDLMWRVPLLVRVREPLLLLIGVRGHVLHVLPVLLQLRVLRVLLQQLRVDLI
jgi:hypothetical protein